MDTKDQKEHTTQELAQKFEITPGPKSKKSEEEEKKDQLFKVIGELKVGG